MASLGQNCGQSQNGGWLGFHELRTERVGGIHQPVFNHAQGSFGPIHQFSKQVNKEIVGSIVVMRFFFPTLLD